MTTRTTRISPTDILNGFLRWKLDAIVVCNLYYRRRPDARIVSASAMGVAYLLANPSMIRFGRSADVFPWSYAIYGKDYYDGCTFAFSAGLPVESLGRDLLSSQREREGYIDGLECIRLVDEHKVPVIGRFQGFGPPAEGKPFDPTTDSVFVHTDDPALYPYLNEQNNSPVQVDESAADIRGE